jgi:hypothetical protein
MLILSEIGNDMSCFSNASALVAGQDCVRETMNRQEKYSREKPCTETIICEPYWFSAVGRRDCRTKIFSDENTVFFPNV